MEHINKDSREIGVNVLAIAIRGFLSVWNISIRTVQGQVSRF
jgi:hypothetical protein